jgi:hypothetical protein
MGPLQRLTLGGRSTGEKPNAARVDAITFDINTSSEKACYFSENVRWCVVLRWRAPGQHMRVVGERDRYHGLEARFAATAALQPAFRMPMALARETANCCKKSHLPL